MTSLERPKKKEKISYIYLNGTFPLPFKKNNYWNIVALQCQFLLQRRVSQLCIPSFWISFQCRAPQSIEQRESPLPYSKFSLVIYFIHSSVRIGEGTGDPLQYSCLENPMDGGVQQAEVHGVAKSQTRLSNFTFTFPFRALEKEMATHSSVLAWRIPGTAEPGGLPSTGSHRVGYYCSDLAAAAVYICQIHSSIHFTPFPPWYICFLHIWLYICFTNRFMSIVFLDSTYK